MTKKIQITDGKSKHEIVTEFNIENVQKKLKSN